MRLKTLEGSFFLLGLIILFILSFSTSSHTETVENSTDKINYEKQSLPRGKLYVITIPHQAPLEIRPITSEKLQPLSVLIEALQNSKQVVFGINGGFFDPKNQKTASHIYLNGNPIDDPTQNERLVNNNSLKPYLKGILNRSEFRIYHCKNADSNGHHRQYDIAFHGDLPPKGVASATHWVQALVCCQP